MTEPASPRARRLVGRREHVADTVRHLVSLFVATMAVVIAVAPAEAFRGSFADELVGTARLLVMCAVVTVVAHGLVTWWCGRVSIARSALCTWCALTLAMAVPFASDGAGEVVSHVLLASGLTLPVVLVQTALRVFVPPFQVRVGGERIRPVMSGYGAPRRAVGQSN